MGIYTLLGISGKSAQAWPGPSQGGYGRPTEGFHAISRWSASGGNYSREIGGFVPVGR
jgi:hypothetical protein